jgi:hypothetical protein
MTFVAVSEIEPSCIKHMDLAIRKVHRIYSATIPATAMIATWIVHVPACYHRPRSSEVLQGLS